MKFLALLLVLATCAGSVPSPNDPVRVPGGLLQGTTGADPAVHVYRGIPYAAPPVGALRWRAPQPVNAWEALRPTAEFGASCIQPLPRSRRPWTKEYMVQNETSEDCLFLNVWTAAASADERRPVFVYIHGGGFNEGSGEVALYDGEALARKGLVVVTINYRVGAAGFLAHPELTAEAGYSGNYGLLDQIAALEWVRDNAAAFGGDPANVTIAGQSAGGVSVYLLTASPLAKGLFHRAIVQSGPGGLASIGLATTRSTARPLAAAELDGVAFAEARGASSLAELRALPAEALLPVEGGPPMRFGAVVDGHFLPDHPADIYARGEQADVPMLTGLNADEASAFFGYGQTTVEAFRSSAAERYGDRSAAFLALYAAETDEEAGQALRESLRHLGLAGLIRLATERAATARTNAYLYFFERGIPWPEYPEFGAFHSGEIPYVFDNLALLDRPWESVDVELAETTSAYWANFAATGDPNGAGRPVWPAFNPAEPAVMVLGAEPAARRALDPEPHAFFEAYIEGQAGR